MDTVHPVLGYYLGTRKGDHGSGGRGKTHVTAYAVKLISGAGYKKGLHLQAQECHLTWVNINQLSVTRVDSDTQMY